MTGPLRRFKAHRCGNPLEFLFAQACWALNGL